MFKIGKVTNYYSKLGVAIIELDGTLSVGDKVRFLPDEKDSFEQIVESIQIEHQKKDSANKGDVIALKTNETVKAGTQIYKVS